MTKLELVHALKESEREQVVLKVRIKGEETPFLGVVDRLSEGNIVFKPYTIYGKRLQRTKFELNDIDRVMMLHLPYNQGIFPVMGSTRVFRSPE